MFSGSRGEREESRLEILSRIESLLLTGRRACCGSAGVVVTTLFDGSQGLLFVRDVGPFVTNYAPRTRVFSIHRLRSIFIDLCLSPVSFWPEC
jgi:hypothetical protein